MMRLLLVLALIYPAIHLFAQQDRWDSYMAEYEQGPGTIILNMALVERAPDRELPYVVVTGVTFTNCRGNGLAAEEELPRLYSLTDQIEQRITREVFARLAGSFTYQCEHLNYIYVEDTTNVRTILKKLYMETFPGQTPYISIQQDSVWAAYLSFLYPTDEQSNYYMTQDAWEQLEQTGDDFSQPRQVEHRIYFRHPEDLDTFVRYVESDGFTIREKVLTGDSDFPCLLLISRTEYIDMVTFNVVVERLETQAETLGGKYDGWEAVVVKE